MNTIDMDRVQALILYRGTLWKSDINHQCCLDDILRSEGTSCKEKYGYDLGDTCLEQDYDLSVSAISEITASLFETENNDVIGFDLWQSSDNNLYLVCHFKSDAEKYLDYMLNYCKEHNYHYGYYISGDDFNLIC